MATRRHKTSDNTVTIGLTQMACANDPAGNRRRQLHLLEQAADRGARVLCTQELFRSHYFCQCEDYRFFDLAETIPGPSTDALCKLAGKRSVVIVGSLFEKRARGLYHNTAVVIDADGSILGLYRKMHIPDDPLYYEKFYFTPGDTGFRSWKTRYANIGVLICWDQWFPEAARLTALAGAEILFYPTAIGWHPAEKQQFGAAQHEAWELIQRSHAIANGCYVCAANRIGHEHMPGPDGNKNSALRTQHSGLSNQDAAPSTQHSALSTHNGIDFWGQSFVASPDGQVMHRASAAREEVVVVPCDLGRVDFSRTHWPFLRDRRIDAYADLSRRFID
ncbi:MAG: carbon-nitrogen hydrolase [Tepidisphaerales bacterium]